MVPPKGVFWGVRGAEGVGGKARQGAPLPPAPSLLPSADGTRSLVCWGKTEARRLRHWVSLWFKPAARKFGCQPRIARKGLHRWRDSNHARQSLQNRSRAPRTCPPRKKFRKLLDTRKAGCAEIIRWTPYPTADDKHADRPWWTGRCARCGRCPLRVLARQIAIHRVVAREAAIRGAVAGLSGFPMSLFSILLSVDSP
jgi:ribosomal protein S14